MPIFLGVMNHFMHLLCLCYNIVDKELRLAIKKIIYKLAAVESPGVNLLTIPIVSPAHIGQHVSVTTINTLQDIMVLC